MTRQRSKRAALVALCAFGLLLFSALGFWQVERRVWKLDLIERVDARIHAAPVAIPPKSSWSTLDPAHIEYRKVEARGRLGNDRETLVQALTERGAGYWVITPLVTSDGTVLVNRGFVPEDAKSPAARRQGQVEGPVTIRGLMRLSEPKGRILRTNRPAEERWYSRDVAAIAKARGLGPVAPFFIDADATPSSGGLPVGGLTVVTFRNAHLAYALTWFGLALMSAAGLFIVLRGRQERA